MANFLNSRQFTTEKPQITVDAGLPVGKHRFEVTAIYRDSRRSRPVEVAVTIVESAGRAGSGSGRHGLTGRSIDEATDPIPIGGTTIEDNGIRRPRLGSNKTTRT
jgi:hypothetical protein